MWVFRPRAETQRDLQRTMTTHQSRRNQLQVRRAPQRQTGGVYSVFPLGPKRSLPRGTPTNGIQLVKQQAAQFRVLLFTVCRGGGGGSPRSHVGEVPFMFCYRGYRGLSGSNLTFISCSRVFGNCCRLRASGEKAPRLKPLHAQRDREHPAEVSGLQEKGPERCKCCRDACYRAHIRTTCLAQIPIICFFFCFARFGGNVLFLLIVMSTR